MKTKTFTLYGIGNAIMDLQVQCAEEDIVTLGLEKAAMRLVDLDQQEKLLDHFHGMEVKMSSGGSAANTVIGFAQLGGKGAYGCLVGDDLYGRHYRDEMKHLGIELNGGSAAGEPTGTCVILITPDAERTMNTHLGASAGFDAQHVSEEMLSASEWLYIEGYLFSSEGGRRAVEKAITLAKKHGVRIAVTFSDGFIVDVFGEALRKAVSRSDLVFANLAEAAKFTGKTGEDAIFSALCEAAPNVMMTMSERGAWVRYDGTTERLEAYPVKAVDDTGAGDMCAGGFLYGITHNLSVKDSGRLACFLASRIVAQFGARLQGDLNEVLSPLKLDGDFPVG